MNSLLIYTADINEYSDDFYSNTLNDIQTVKKIDKYKGLDNQKESILAWYIIKQYSIKHNIPFKFIEKENHKKDFYCENIHFNISHSKGKVCVGFFSNEIGVDIEHISDKTHHNIYKRILCNREIDSLRNINNEQYFFTKIWTLKESSVKYTGKGIVDNLKKFDFSSYLNNHYFYYNDLFYYTKKIDNYVLSCCSKEPFIVNIAKYKSF